jgi:hypothetical protein
MFITVPKEAWNWFLHDPDRSEAQIHALFPSDTPASMFPIKVS